MTSNEIERFRTWERKYAEPVCPDWVEMDAVSFAGYFTWWKAKASRYQTFDEVVAESPFFKRTSCSPATKSPPIFSEQPAEQNPSQRTGQPALPISCQGLSRGTRSRPKPAGSRARSASFQQS